MDEITNVENFFKSHRVHLSRVWLESCINWCKEESLPPNYTLKDLQFNVFEQWLSLDLRDVEEPSLPPNLNDQQKYILNNNYTLQLLKVIDISKPKYWQLQRIRNGIQKNHEQDTESSKRLLQLTLTDGVQEIEAMEYEPIKCLHVNLPPGSKIRLMGPITIRRGRLLLEEKHVKLIGGEVDSLLVPNAAENILAKCLNRPLNPNPKGIQESVLADEVKINETGISSATINEQNKQTTSITTTHQNKRTISSSNRSPTNINSNNFTNRHNSKHADNLEDFEDEFGIDQEMLMAAEVFEESNIPNKNQIKSLISNRCKTPDMFEDMDIDFESIQIPEIINKVSNIKDRCKEFESNEPQAKKQRSGFDNIHNQGTNSKPNSYFQQEITNFFDKSKQSNSTSHLPKITLNDFQHNVINLTDSLEEDNKNAEIQNVNIERSISTPKIIPWTVEKLVRTMSNVTNGKFKITAKFKCVKEKLRVVDEAFHLVIEVGDETGNVVVKVKDDVVEELMALTSADFKGFVELAKVDSEGQRKALDALMALQKRLLALDNGLEVLINVKEPLPLLVKIL